MNIIPTIQELRRAKYKIRVFHLRNINKEAKKNAEMTLVCLNYFKSYYIQSMRSRLTHGGKTIIELTPPGFPSNVVFVGSSLCSYRDNFSYKQGVKFALKRALDDYRKSVYNM